MPETRRCRFCGGDAVEQTAEGLYCTSCHKTVDSAKPMVHHETLPRTVPEEKDEES